MCSEEADGLSDVLAVSQCVLGLRLSALTVYLYATKAHPTGLVNITLTKHCFIQMQDMFMETCLKYIPKLIAPSTN